MTEEIPLDRGVRCDDCNSTVYLARKDNKTLIARCDCDKQRSIKVARVLPEGWA